MAGTQTLVAAASSGHNLYEECSVIPTESPPPTYDELLGALTVPQAEDTSGRSSFVLREAIRTGKLPAYKVGGRWRILHVDLDAYLKALVTPSRGTR